MKKYFIAIVLQVLFVSCLSAQYGYRWTQKQTGTAYDLSDIISAYTPDFTYPLMTCGANGTILLSTDIGNTWTSKSLSAGINLYSMCCANPNYYSVVCCGDSGKIFISTNTGTSWVQMSTSTTTRLNCIISHADNLIAAGNNGTILVSNWTGSSYSPFVQVTSGVTADLKSLYDDGYIYACGTNGKIIKSFNQGLNWSPIFFPGAVNLNTINSIDDRMLVFADNGIIYLSTNGGNNWTNLTSGVSINLKSFAYPSYVFGSQGTLLYNKSYCSMEYNWVRMQIPTSADLNSGTVYNNDKYAAVGSNGTFLLREIDTSLFVSKINANNICTFGSYRGAFDRSMISSNMTPGFEWPRGTGKTLIFSTGLSASCMINGQLAQTMCIYNGEYFPGAIRNGQLFDSSIFRLYKVSRSDGPSSPDWLNWGSMVPYGAPYVDVNNNGIYEPLIDTPGVKNAAQTFFVCLTDLNPCSHNASEGFGGGITSPIMGIELHMTRWEYTYPSFNNVIFTKFEILNKGASNWTGTRFAIISDPDVGSPDDDYIGCDTIRNMGYAYNRTNNDPVYGAAPPAVGYDVLKGPVNKNVTPNITYNMSSFTRYLNCNSDPPNECDPGSPNEAYTIMKGYKSDGANWLDPTQPTGWGSFKRSKKIFYGDPETNQGWTPQQSYIVNYGNDSVGTLASNESLRDKRFVQGMGADNYTINSGDTAVIWLAQFAARGTSNLNSVTRLKELSDIVQAFYESNFTVGINQISEEVPLSFSLMQNYPNPFNPETKIRFALPEKSFVTIKIYNVLGQLIDKPVDNKHLNAGTYQTKYNGSKLASGIYFYRIETEKFTQTKRMVLIK
ncbi:MAG: T9SS type A sorting domain-containing protein [Ignavibacteria bacterium]|nr:T9SS type A sorting domain-containing protein [Ignavibacteria bacterium]